VIGSPFSVNQIIANRVFSRLADIFTFQLCWLSYPNLGLTYESQLRIGWFTMLLIISHILVFAKSLVVAWGTFQVVFVTSSLKVCLFLVCSNTSPRFLVSINNGSWLQFNKNFCIIVSKSQHIF